MAKDSWPRCSTSFTLPNGHCPRSSIAKTGPRINEGPVAVCRDLLRPRFPCPDRPYSCCRSRTMLKSGGILAANRRHRAKSSARAAPSVRTWLDGALRNGSEVPIRGLGSGSWFGSTNLGPDRANQVRKPAAGSAAATDPAWNISSAREKITSHGYSAANAPCIAYRKRLDRPTALPSQNTSRHPSFFDRLTSQGQNRKFLP